MAKQKLILLFLVIAVGVSCTSAHKPEETGDGSTERGTASVDPATVVDPVTGKTFRQTMDDLDAKRLLPGKVKELLKLKAFGKWVRMHPVATFTELLKSSVPLEMESLPVDKKKEYDHDGTFVVAKYADVVEVLNQPAIFSTRNYRRKMENSVGPFLMAYDETAYNLKEKPWMRKMLPKEDLPRVRAIVRELVQKAIAENQYTGKDLRGRPFGRLELVNSVARKVPVQLTGRYFGFPGPSEAKMYEWSRATQDDFFHNIGKKDENEHVFNLAGIAGKEMHAYLKELIAQKKNSPPTDDIVSRLVHNQVNEFVEPISAEDDRLRTNIMGLLVGGVETTQAVVVQSIDQLMRRPEAFKAAVEAARRNDVDTVAKYAWEAQRFHPLNPFVVRYAEADYTLQSGARIRKGAHVLVATQAAMLDPDVFPRPLVFDINRDQTKFFHLGYGHHRCLGDYISEIQVPEIIMAILQLPGLKRASGAAGRLDFRKRMLGSTRSTSFPESFSVEFDVPSVDSQKVSVANPAYAYEDYLMTFDRHAYRQCLANLDVNKPEMTKKDALRAIPTGIAVHKLNVAKRDNRHLLFCRLNAGFQTCMLREAKARKFEVLGLGQAHDLAYASCKREHPLTETESAFYENVMLGRDLQTDRIRTDQARRTTGPDYEFEDHLKFYDRYSYRECFMNPAGVPSFPNSREMIMYARLNLDFRKCMGLPVLKHKYTKGLIGKDRETQYDICKDGIYDENTSIKYGALSETEKYFYETMVLGRKLPLPEGR